MQRRIVHNKERQQFEYTEDGLTAYVAYEEIPRGIDFIATFVPDALQGRGIGSVLAEYALEYAREHRLRVKATCPFIRDYMEKHNESAER